MPKNNHLTTATGRRAGTEFACASVSSPGFEAPLAGNAAAVQGFEQANQLLIDDLQYLDASKRGYTLAEFTAGAATAKYRPAAGLGKENAATTTGRTVTEV